MAAAGQERRALKALWRRVLGSKLDGAGGWNAHALLETDVWRTFWRVPADDLSPSSLKLYEITARRLLLRHAPDQEDPLHRVRRSWTELPKSLKAELAPIRKTAERALLRPRDVTPDWLEEGGLQDADLAAVRAALDGLDQTMAAVRTGATPDPVAAAWQALREAARAQAIDTSRFSAIVAPALGDHRCHRAVDRQWAIHVSTGLTHRANARFSAAVRMFDAMHEHPTLATLLPARRIGELPDRRRKGNLDLPAGIAHDLEAAGLALGHAANTRKENRSLVRELFTRAAARNLLHEAGTLDRLLRRAARLGLTGRKLRKAENLLAKISA